VGSDSTGKKELDSRLQIAKQGKFEDAVRSSLVNVSNVVEIGKLAHRRGLHRGRGVGNNGDCRLTIFDL